MTTGIAGPAAVPWRQTFIGGRADRAAETLCPGALWGWTGPLQRLDAAAGLVLLAGPGEALFRDRAARRARRLCGLPPSPPPGPPVPLPRGPEAFVVIDGARRYPVVLRQGPGGLFAIFADRAPPPDRALCVVEVTGAGLPLRLDLPAFLPGGFAPGTGIATPGGLVPVERLAPGDRVLARDGGTRQVACATRWQTGGGRVQLAPRLAPVQIRAGALGPGLPSRDLLVAPGQEIAVAGPDVLAATGRPRVLLPAARLAGLPGVTALPGAAADFVRLTLAVPDLVLAEGIGCATARPADPAGASPEAIAAPQPDRPAADRALSSAGVARLLAALAGRAVPVEGH